MKKETVKIGGGFATGVFSTLVATGSITIKGLPGMNLAFPIAVVGLCGIALYDKSDEVKRFFQVFGQELKKEFKGGI